MARALYIILVPGALIAARTIGTDDFTIGAEGQPDPRMAKRIAIAIAGHPVLCHIDGICLRYAGVVAGVVAGGAAVCAAGRHHPSISPSIRYAHESSKAVKP